MLQKLRQLRVLYQCFTYSVGMKIRSVPLSLQFKAGFSVRRRQAVNWTLRVLYRCKEREDSGVWKYGKWKFILLIHSAAWILPSLIVGVCCISNIELWMGSQTDRWKLNVFSVREQASVGHFSFPFGSCIAPGSSFFVLFREYLCRKIENNKQTKIKKDDCVFHYCDARSKNHLM